MSHFEPVFFELQRAEDSRGLLSIFNSLEDLPFEVKRVFFLSNVPPNKSRGAHGHFRCEQYFFCLSGSCKIQFSTTLNEGELTLSTSVGGLLVPPGVYLELSNFTADCVIGIFASDTFDSSDYFYDKPFKGGNL
jgi:hypothetical protein